MLGPGHPLGEADATAELVEGFRGRHAGDLHEVFLLHAISGVGQEVGQIAVIGDEDQPFTHPVEPPDGKQPLFTRHEIDDARPAVGIEIRRHDPDRLGEHVDHPLGVGEPLAIDADFLTERIDPRAQLRHHLAVDFDAPRRDQLLAIPPAAEPGSGEDLLEPIHAVVLGHDRRRPTASPRGLRRGHGVTSLEAGGSAGGDPGGPAPGAGGSWRGWVGLVGGHAGSGWEADGCDHAVVVRPTDHTALAGRRRGESANERRGGGGPISAPATTTASGGSLGPVRCSPGVGCHP